MNNNSENSSSQILSISLCLFLVFYIVLELISKSEKYKAIMSINLSPEIISQNFIAAIIFLIIYIMIIKPNNVFQFTIMDFGVVILAFVYSIVLTIAKFNYMTITKKDIETGENKNKKAPYTIMLSIGAIIAVVGIYFSMVNTSNKNGNRELLTKFFILCGFGLLLAIIIALRDKESTNFQPNIAIISYLLLFFIGNNFDNVVLKLSSLFFIIVFLLNTIIFGPSMLISSKNQSLFGLSKETCKKIMEYSPDEETPQNQLNEKIINIQWIIVLLSVCFIGAIILFMFLYM